MSKIKEETKQRLLEIAENIKNSDPRLTADPFYFVQTLNREYGVDCDYGYDGYIWVDDCGQTSEFNHDEYTHDEDCKAENWEDCECECSENITQVFYRDRWENYMPFLSEKGAQEYININGHNLDPEGIPPRIYGECLYRNHEMLDIKSALLELLEVES
jgi:hypothetical protein